MINFIFKLNLYRHDIICHLDIVYKKLLINKIITRHVDHRLLKNTWDKWNVQVAAHTKG